MEAIILAGGLGTRLSSAVPDLPKALAPVNGVPFLDYVLTLLIKNGIDHFVLAVGNKAQLIISHYGFEYKGIKIDYAFENEPLGTGGAIKNALAYCEQDRVFVINGDTFMDVNFAAMYAFHAEQGRPITLCAKPMRDFDRYGSLEIRNFRVNRFIEKKPTKIGRINAGIYLVEKSVFEQIPETVFSFEKHVLENEKFHVSAFESDGYFIDIGIAEDLERAQTELSLPVRAKAAFVDRDGTLNIEVSCLNGADKFNFIFGAEKAVETLHKLGYIVIVVTNQAGVAKGYFPESAVRKIHAHIDKKLRKCGTYIDAYYYCPHHPAAVNDQYRVDCDCRKPKTGMIEKALADFREKNIEISLADSVFIGDTDEDMLTAVNAKIGKRILVRTGHGASADSAAADFVIDSIANIEQIKGL